MKYPRLTFLSAWLVLASTGLLHAQNQIPNPSFEDGATDWYIFIPPESTNDNCQFTISTDSPHSGKNCAELQSDDFARYSINPKIDDFHPNPGERYHITAWVKADPTTQVQPGAPGIVIRVTLQLNDKDAVGGHFFLELNNVMTRGTNPPPIAPDAPTSPAPSANPANAVTPTPAPGMIKLPTVWTKMEGDFTMPDDADSVGLNFFAWYTKGPIYFDDVSVEKLP